MPEKTETEIVDLCRELFSLFMEKPITNDDDAAVILIRIFNRLKYLDGERVEDA